MSSPSGSADQDDTPKIREKFHQFNEVFCTCCNLVSLYRSDLRPVLIPNIPRDDIPNCNVVAADRRGFQLLPKVSCRLISILERNETRFNRFRTWSFKNEQVLCAFVPIVWIKIGHFLAQDLLGADPFDEGSERSFHDA